MANGELFVKAVRNPITHFVVLAGLAWGFCDVAKIIKECEICWTLVIALGSWSVVSVLHLVLGCRDKRRIEDDLAQVKTELQAVPSAAKPPAELESDSDLVVQKMTDLLRGVVSDKDKGETSLYYYGGAGIIGRHGTWRDLYEEMLGAENVKLVRLVDLKNLKEMEESVLNKMDEPLRKRDLKEYKTWIETHRDNLDDDKAGRSHERGNSFFSFEGAPLWKYGIHVVVFGERDVAFTFVTGDRPDEEQRNAIIIRDQEKIAKAITRSIRWQRKRLCLKAKGSMDLAEILAGGTQS